MDRPYGTGIDHYPHVPQPEPAHDQAPSLDLFVCRTSGSCHHVLPRQGVWLGWSAAQFRRDRQLGLVDRHRSSVLGKSGANDVSRERRINK